MVGIHIVKVHIYIYINKYKLFELIRLIKKIAFKTLNIREYLVLCKYLSLSSVKCSVGLSSSLKYLHNEEYLKFDFSHGTLTD